MHCAVNALRVNDIVEKRFQCLIKLLRYQMAVNLRKTELGQNLRSISPDSSHYPVQSILVRLHQVSSKPRSLFKSLISDVVKQVNLV